MQALIDSFALRDDSKALRARLDADSYLFFRGALDRGHIARVRAAVLEVLRADGWLRDDAPVDEGRVSELAEPEAAPPSAHYFATYRGVQQLQEFHELAIDPQLIALAEKVVGGPVFTFPMKIARLGVPTPERWTTPAHQDYPLIGGTADVLTTWIPLGDSSPGLGGLKILRGSHRAGLRSIIPSYGVGGVGVEADPEDDNWATADFRMGDVLLFHSMTVHGAVANETDRIRLSADFRYQSVASAIGEKMLIPHYYPGIPSYEELTKGWTSTRSVEAPAGLTVLGPDSERPPLESTIVSFD